MKHTINFVKEPTIWTEEIETDEQNDEMIVITSSSNESTEAMDFREVVCFSVASWFRYIEEDINCFKEEGLDLIEWTFEKPRNKALTKTEELIMKVIHEMIKNNDDAYGTT